MPIEFERQQERRSRNDLESCVSCGEGMNELLVIDARDLVVCAACQRQARIQLELGIRRE